MKVLIRKGTPTGTVAHIACNQGQQLCETNIKRSIWEIHPSAPEGIVICRKCWKIYATMQASPLSSQPTM